MAAEYLSTTPAADRLRPEPLVPLALENRSHVPTREAARHVGRRPQTLRIWACTENGPIRPVRVHGRLMWPVSELRRLLAEGAA